MMTNIIMKLSMSLIINLACQSKIEMREIFVSKLRSKDFLKLEILLAEMK